MTSHAGLDPARDADILIEQGEHTREGAADANPFRDGEGGGGSSSRAVQDLASKSPVQIAVRRLAYDKIAMMSLGVVLLFVILGIFAETINSARGVDPVLQDTTFISPGGYPTYTASPEHPFGIETGTGRDLLARWLIGIRPSLIIAVVAATAVTIIGTALAFSAVYWPNAAPPVGLKRKVTAGRPFWSKDGWLSTSCSPVTTARRWRV